MRRHPDLPNTLVIDVTQADIDAGIRGSCKQCPIANAIKRTLPFDDLFVYVSSTIQVGRINTDFPITSYKITNEVDCFIENFDNSVSVEPETFQLIEMDV